MPAGQGCAGANTAGLAGWWHLDVCGPFRKRGRVAASVPPSPCRPLENPFPMHRLSAVVAVVRRCQRRRQSKPVRIAAVLHTGGVVVCGDPAKRAALHHAMTIHIEWGSPYQQKADPVISPSTDALVRVQLRPPTSANRRPSRSCRQRMPWSGCNCDRAFVSSSTRSCSRQRMPWSGCNCDPPGKGVSVAPSRGCPPN